MPLTSSFMPLADLMDARDDVTGGMQTVTNDISTQTHLHGVLPPNLMHVTLEQALVDDIMNQGVPVMGIKGPMRIKGPIKRLRVL